MKIKINFEKVKKWKNFLKIIHPEEEKELRKMYEDAREELLFYDWCVELTEEYVGMFFPGIIGIFLFKIKSLSEEVDEWSWVVVGDIPHIYITCEECPNPAAALEGYIGAMMEWVEAAESERSVADLVPVNVPANKEYAEMLRSRLEFLDEKILSQFREDLKE